jgi:hypothetical protein
VYQFRIYIFHFLTSIFLYSNEKFNRSLPRQTTQREKTKNKNKNTGDDDDWELKEGAIVGRREQFGSHFTSDISNLPTVSSSIPPPPPVISFFFFLFFF